MARTPIDPLNEGAEHPDDEPVSRVTRLAPPAPTIDIAAIVKAAVEAALSAGRANTHDLSDAITKGMEQVRTPKPENVESNGISHLNPLGDLAHPRPGLKCDMWLGAIDDTDGEKVKRAWEIFPEDCTVWEQLALNMLEPVEKVIERLDGMPLKVIVEPKRNSVTGHLDRLVIGLPLALIGKKGENRNMVPGLADLAYQLTGVDFRMRTWPFPEKKDDLAWVMAEHKAGRYVAKRETVAA